MIMAYIVMAYIIMVYIVMAYIVMALQIFMHNKRDLLKKTPLFSLTVENGDVEQVAVACIVMA